MSGADADRLSDLSEALEGLEAADARLARIVDLEYFCGFSFVEIGNMLGLSERTVQRDWEKARIYLHRVLKGRSAAGVTGFPGRLRSHLRWTLAWT